MKTYTDEQVMNMAKNYIKDISRHSNNRKLTRAEKNRKKRALNGK